MRYLFISVLLCLISFSYIKTTDAKECLPNCSVVDGKFLAIAGTALSTIAGAELVVNLVSKGDNLSFGIFDGDAGGLWDLFGGGGYRNTFKLRTVR